MSKAKEVFKKAWKKITESKLNIGMFVTGVIAFVLMVTIVCIIIFRGDGIDNTLIVTPDTAEAQDETTSVQETATTGDNDIEKFTTKIDESETTNVVTTAGLLKVETSVAKSWADDGEYFIQYNVKVTNMSGKDIDSWALVFDMKSSYDLVDSWNFTCKEGNKKLIINPTNSNKDIQDKDSVTGGFIVKGSQYVYIDYYTAYIGDKVETLKSSNTYVQPTTTKIQPTTGSDDTTTTRGNAASTSTTNNTGDNTTVQEHDATTTVKGEEDDQSTIATTTPAEINTTEETETITPKPTEMETPVAE